MYENNTKAYAGEEVEQSEMQRELMELDAATNELREVMNRLVDRLTPVLRMEQEGKSAGAPTPEVSLAPYPERIRDNRRNVGKTIAEIQSVLRRLSV